MSVPLLAVLGVTAGGLQIVGMVPYFRDIFRGSTKPERATWWIWSLLNAVSLGAQIGAHAHWSLLMTLGQGLVTLTVALVSLRFGYGTFHKKDALALVFALGGVGLWWALNSPLAALLVVLAVDVVGFWLTLEKTWSAPHTETLATWFITAISGLLGVLAVGKLNITQLLYPLYIMCGNWLMVGIIVYRRPRLKPKG